MMSGRDQDEDIDGEASAWPSGELLRLIFVPSIVVILFIGGVYWLRLQVDSAGGSPEPQSVVQVQLLPRPDPLPIPVPAPQSKPTSTAALDPAPANDLSKDTALADSQALAALPAEVQPERPSASSLNHSAISDAPPDPAALQFKEALFRHILRYQRYPKAAESKGLQGTVKAVFSMDREGKLLGVWIKSSSGQAALDQAAIDTIRRAQPLPVIPPALPDSMTVDVALGFDPS
jgi:periplasmic protein TonB